MFSGDQGISAETMKRAVANISDANLAVLENYESSIFADVIADRGIALAQT
jgi:hypothetical protein